jgi:hypothetical protein
MFNDSISFCTPNTGVILCPSEKSIYITAALSSFSGSFGTVSVGAGQSLSPYVPIKFDSTVSGAANTLFYYLE